MNQLKVQEDHLSVELGPGIIGSIFDGIQRPLEKIKVLTGDYLQRGVTVPSLNKETKWTFKPTITAGTEVKGGDVIGEVQETSAILQKIMIPPKVEGKLISIVPEGQYTVEEEIAEVETSSGIVKVPMMQKWPVRVGRPYKAKLDPDIPLVTGQRAQDTFFPVAKGGTCSYARSIWIRKNCYTTAACKMGRCRYYCIRRLWRTW